MLCWSAFEDTLDWLMKRAVWKEDDVIMTGYADLVSVDRADSDLVSVDRADFTTSFLMEQLSF